MFKFLTDSIENAIDVSVGVLDVATGGEPPTKKQVAKLLADGLTVYAAAEVLGVGVEIVESLIDEQEQK